MKAKNKPTKNRGSVCKMHPWAGVEIKVRGSCTGRPLYICSYCKRSWTEGNPYKDIES